MKLTRRGLLASAAAGAGAMAVPGATQASGYGQDAIPFYGRHQSGVTTPVQAHLHFAAFDVEAHTAASLRDLLRAWSEAAAVMCGGHPDGSIGGDVDAAPADTGDAYGLRPARLTVTLGLGASLFDGRFGLAERRPPALADLPSFPADQLDPARSGGDLGVQACADDPQVAFHAVRMLARLGSGVVRQRWAQEGFSKTPGMSPSTATGRNLLGFKDGTNNLRTTDRASMLSNVWVNPGDGPEWMTWGSYMVTRRVRNHIEDWDASALGEQQQTIGRYKVSGAPLGRKHEFDPAVPALLPPDCHILQANPRTAGSEGERILRRGYNFSDGVLASGELDAGLFFIAYQRDPRRQFVTIQRRLAAHDLLNEYLVHTSSALFAVPPGCRHRGYVGQTLLG
jgi:deferrochelatase/peroxidase EfeB